MTKGENFIKKRKCKNIHCSSMSNSAWCDLNSKGDVVKLHDMCPKPKCKCQRQITLIPRQYQPEGAGFKNKLPKNLKSTRTVLEF